MMKNNIEGQGPKTFRFNEHIKWLERVVALTHFTLLKTGKKTKNFRINSVKGRCKISRETRCPEKKFE